VTFAVAALLFGTVIVAGLTSVSLAALRYVRHLDEPDPIEDRCPAFRVWHGIGSTNKDVKYPRRCTLGVAHAGPHRIDHPMSKGEDYWWVDEKPKDVPAKAAEPGHESGGGEARAT
jgi:hypothetical protein